ncbi:MAG TPA: hypothetical protein VE954_06640 [Oligoflexus sp.]|uniref:hypothetical protein n=1 Tax=Oligoflexus sp. TaxID=1971216 RepID=UPI002D470B2F|nr:hypothetical protein [Oligoflexus sp.]HYX32774.1 hypothetical protein [Oligoflexus sp.]
MVSFSNLTFDKVPFAKLELDTSLANLSGSQPFSVLILGKTKEKVVGKKPIRVTGREAAGAKFGKDSAIYGMVDQFLSINRSTPLWVLPFTEEAALDTSEAAPLEGKESFKSRLESLKDANQFNIAISEWNDVDHLGIIGAIYGTLATADISREGLVFSAVYGTRTEISDFEKTKDINFKFMTIAASPPLKTKNSDGTEAEFPAFRLSAAIAATVALEAEKSPGRPFNGLTIQNVPAYDREAEYTREELNGLVGDGFSVYRLNGDGVPEILRMVTTYTQDSAGTPDDSFQNINDFFIASRLRFRWVNYFHKKYVSQRYMLAGDDDPVPAGAMILQPKMAKAEALAIFEGWQDEGLVKNAKLFQQSLIVEYNKKGIMEFSFNAAFIDQLLGLAAKLFKM